MDSQRSENGIPSTDEGSWWFMYRSMKIVLAHTVCFAAALFLSFLLYHNMLLGDWVGNLYWKWLLVVLPVKLLVFGLYHQYQGWWRYASVHDFLSIIKATHISTLIVVFGWYLGYRIELTRDLMGDLVHVPVTVMLMDWASTIIVVCGVRLAFRLYYEETQATPSGRLSRLLIVGAGNAGEVLLREIDRSPVARYEVVGFVDDDPQKLRMRIHGIPVLGTTRQIKAIAAQHSIDEIIIAMPSATHRQLRQVISHCQGANLRFSTIPDLMSIASGKVKVSQIRNVDIHDLLGREPVDLETALISDFLCGKTVVVTGAGGSIGSEICRQVLQFAPGVLILLEQAENNLFVIENELRRRFPNATILAFICDVVDTSRVTALFHEHRPEVVFHAAAHKHVPLMELNPGEAVKNNIIGTRNVARLADAVHASHFVFISTDKAVNPTSMMGASKRVAEMIVQVLDRHSDTDYVTVRFGNVLGSTGSVIPIFSEQIARGGPVTVTHPEMQRYFMTIPEASQLTLQAAAMGQGGEVFVLEMGEPIKIVDLARDLITLSGFRPDDDIEIVFTGIRPGEKLFEELAMSGEDMQPTRHSKIAIWKNVPADSDELDTAVAELVAMVDQKGAYPRIVETIKRIVPEYLGRPDERQSPPNPETNTDPGTDTDTDTGTDTGPGTE